MKLFTLEPTYTTHRSGLTQIELRPSDDLIQDYISAYRSYETLAEAQADEAAFIIEQTPILYHIFIYTDSIPEEIRNQYELA